MRVLITTFGTLGDLDPYLALGRGLAARGHEPMIGTHDFYRAAVEAEGIGFRPVRPDADPNDRKIAMDPRLGAEFVIRNVVLPHLRDSYLDTADAARDADMIVTHPLTFAGPIVAEEREMAWASTVLSPFPFFSRYDLPVAPPPPRAWRVHGMPGVPDLLIRLAREITRSWIEPVRELREEHGLPPGGHPLYEGQHSPLLTLGLFSRVIAEPQRDWPASAKLTGFLFRDPPLAADPGTAPLEAFLDAGPAPIVFTLGTSAVAVAGSFYEESLAAARMLGKRAVLLVGDDPSNRPEAPLGDDAIVIERAPYGALFPRATAIVHHAGMGTLAQALRSGRPMLAVPWAGDQPDNARRATRIGVAKTLPPKRYQADRVAAELRALLDDPALLARAARIGETVRAEDGVGAACDAIEEAALNWESP
ncbi:MAG TPA: glycosyltransferase [Gemmatimonadota bacterium]|nr:glycosyltransferase [Gemmatimonadota bacterium]